METIYVAVAEWGRYDDKDFSIAYVGTNYVTAVEEANKNLMADNGKVYIEHWLGGIKIKVESL